MPTHHATFINNESKSGYQKNELRFIVTEHTKEGKIRVTSPGAWPGPESIIYDTDADFYKDWRVHKTESYNRQQG